MNRRLLFDLAAFVFVSAMTLWAIIPDLPGCSDTLAWCGLSGIVRGDFLFVLGSLCGIWALVRQAIPATQKPAS